ncbi:hypothetical protein FGB62_95g057 [Gracilaria domingensis]|nr:hypothetical protein FGB62_95g057 [Gracilaria domingensis]
MELSSSILSSSLHPEKLDDVEKWKRRVKFRAIGSPGENRYVFDAAAQSIVHESSADFVGDVLNAIAYTQCTYYDNRTCWSGCITINPQFLERVPSISEITSELVAEELGSYAEALIIGAVEAFRTRPGWLHRGKISIRSYFYRMARNEESFLDASGAKWDSETFGIGCTAHITGHEIIPALPMSTPCLTLLAKHVRTVVVCNLGSGISNHAWYEALCQTFHLGENLMLLLSLFSQHWNVTDEQLAADMELLWKWIDDSFTGRERTLAICVANAFCALPYHNGREEVSLVSKKREVVDGVFGFEVLHTTPNWHATRRRFWISELALSAQLSTKSTRALIYHCDTLYSFIVDGEDANITTPQGQPRAATLLDTLAGQLREMEERGLLEPLRRSFVEHLAGESLTQDTLSKNARVARIRLDARASPTIELTSSCTYPIRLNGRRAKLEIENGADLVLKGRDAIRLARDFVRSLEGINAVGFGGQRRSSPPEGNLRGSMVANLIMQGSFDAGAGLWLLSHILYGDVKVSCESENRIFSSIGGSHPDGLRINVPIDAEIVASIHAATDMSRVFLCLSKSRIFELERRGSSLIAVSRDIDVSNMKGCSLAPLRGVL